MLELMVVLAIVLLLTLLAGPTLDLVQRTRADLEARAVRNQLLQARSMARSTLRCVEVLVSPPRTIATTVYDDCGPPLAEAETPVTVTYADLITLSKWSTGESTLVFDSTGGFEADGPVLLKVRSDYDQSYTYQLFPAYGAMRHNR